jgi:hypothetical protein
MNTLLKKYEALQNKYNNLVNESMPKTLINKKEAFINHNEVPLPERLPNEKPREASTRILSL